MTSTVSKEALTNAISAHAMWKLRLKTAISTKTVDVSPQDASRGDLCEFGKWLRGSNFTAADRAGMPHKVTSRLHSEFHQVAGSILDCVRSGEIEEAKDTMNSKYADISAKLVIALRKWREEL